MQGIRHLNDLWDDFRPEFPVVLGAFVMVAAMGAGLWTWIGPTVLLDAALHFCP